MKITKSELKAIIAKAVKAEMKKVLADSTSNYEDAVWDMIEDSNMWRLMDAAGGEEGENATLVTSITSEIDKFIEFLVASEKALRSVVKGPY